MSRRKRTMKIKIIKFTATSLFLLFAVMVTTAQTGGGYDLSHSVIASGGGSNSTGSTFSVSGTSGQSSAGTTNLTGNQFTLRGGFWAFGAAVPTASTISIQGQVTSLSGKTINNVTILLFDTFTNTTRTTTTDREGRYFFDELEVNHFYIVNAERKLFSFTPESHAFELTANRDDINFIGFKQPQPRQ